jgi:FtsH-binding integral membrane protein
VTSNTLATIAFVAMMAFAMSRRVKRTFGRQPLTRRHLVPRLFILPLVCALVLATWPAPEALAAALAAALLGTALGVWGLKLTRFERGPDGQFYTPNKYLGMMVMVVFFGRMAMRALALSQATADANGLPVTSLPRSAATTALIFFVAAYTVSFSALVLREGRRRAAL